MNLRVAAAIVLSLFVFISSQARCEKAVKQPRTEDEKRIYAEWRVRETEDSRTSLINEIF